jgi:hypothetical protein
MNKIKIAAATLALTAALAGCAYGKSGGSTGGPPTYHSIYDTSTPSPQIDGAPQPTAPVKGLIGDGTYNCVVTITPASTGLLAGKSLVTANAYTMCFQQPRSFRMTIEIQYMNPGSSSWLTEQPMYQTTNMPPIYPATEHHVTSAFCQADSTYRIRITVSGIGHDGRPYYQQRAGNSITFTETQCAH